MRWRSTKAEDEEEGMAVPGKEEQIHKKTGDEG